MYLTGMCLMAYNTWLTMRGTKSVDVRIPALPSHHARPQSPAVPEHA
jgi:cytochrome c oxidase cbb3-type subunit 1